MQECNKILYFVDVGPVPEDDRVALAKDAVSVTEEEAEKNRGKNKLENGGDSELGELRSEIVRDG